MKISAQKGSRLQFWMLMGLLIAGYVGIGVAYGTLAQRRLAIAGQALDRNQSLLRAKLDGLVYAVSDDLRKEAARARMSDISAVQDLLPGWQAVLSANYAIEKIRLADEHGNESAMLRGKDGFLLQVTKQGSAFEPPRSYAIPEGRWTSLDSLPHTEVDEYDPRGRIWFSRALEDRRDEPTWSMGPLPIDNFPDLHVSFLIRSEDAKRPFRVMAFEYHPDRSLEVVSGLFANHPFGMFLMDAEGRLLLDNANGLGADMHTALEQTRQQWLARKQRRSMEVEVGDSLFHAVVQPYLLNGETLYTGVAVGDHAIRIWTKGEELLLLGAVVFLVLLTALLAWDHLRQRRQGLRMMEQERMTTEQEQRLAKALGEKEVLDREVHHRVKNNLQVVSSLLNLQTTRLEEGPLKDEFIRSKRRIDFMALVHQKLYALQDLRGIDLQDLFEKLIGSLSAIYEPRSRTVITDVDTGSISSDPDTAISLGIILCELVANSYQHAFPYATGGHIEARVQVVDGDLMRLVVKDNGVGLRQEPDEGTNRMGLEVVSALAEQLDGSVHIHTNGGATFEVVFRMQRKVQGSLR